MGIAHTQARKENNQPIRRHNGQKFMVGESKARGGVGEAGGRKAAAATPTATWGKGAGRAPSTKPRKQGGRTKLAWGKSTQIPNQRWGRKESWWGKVSLGNSIEKEGYRTTAAGGKKECR